MLAIADSSDHAGALLAKDMVYKSENNRDFAISRNQNNGGRKCDSGRKKIDIVITAKHRVIQGTGILNSMVFQTGTRNYVKSVWDHKTMPSQCRHHYLKHLLIYP